MADDWIGRRRFDNRGIRALRRYLQVTRGDRRTTRIVSARYHPNFARDCSWGYQRVNTPDSGGVPLISHRAAVLHRSGCTKERRGNERATGGGKIDYGICAGGQFRAAGDESAVN